MNTWQVVYAREVHAGELVRFPGGEYQVKEILSPVPEAMAGNVEDIRPSDIAFLTGEGDSQHTFIINGSEQLDVFRRDSLETVLQEGQKFINHALDRLGLSRPTGFDFGPPLDSQGKVLRQHEPAMEAGGMLGLLALSWGTLAHSCLDTGAESSMSDFPSVAIIADVER